jgi:DUF4097 and DUF4098 domain-containing protein YvlB
MLMFRCDFAKFAVPTYETRCYEVCAEYQHISVVTSIADVVLVPSDNGKTSVVCSEEKNVTHSVIVRNGTLMVERVDTRKWYEYIGIRFSAPKITVYLPGKTYGALTVRSNTGKVDIPGVFAFASMNISGNTGDVTSAASVSEHIRIKTTTGNICVEDVSADAMRLSVSTGKVTVSGVKCTGTVAVNVSTGNVAMTDVTCGNLASNGSTGKITLKNVVATGSCVLQRNTGNIRFEDCDAAEIFAETNTGDVTGSLRTEKVFVAQSDTGWIRVPKTSTGGRCEITTNTGNIRMKIA